MKEEIRAIIVDDNAEFRNSVRLLLSASEGFTFVAGFDSGEGIENVLKHLHPDVVLMDIDMPQISGIEVVKKIRAVNTQIPIVMLTSFEDDDKVFDSICAGANGYLLKNASPGDIVGGLVQVCAGGAPMTPSIASKVLQMMQKANAPKMKKPLPKLSPRELDVLHLLVDGKSYKMIASDLGVSFETVHSHIKKIYKALHVNSATEAVAKSIRDGLV